MTVRSGREGVERHSQEAEPANPAGRIGLAELAEHAVRVEFEKPACPAGNTELEKPAAPSSHATAGGTEAAAGLSKRPAPGILRALDAESAIANELAALADPAYRQFQAKLVPTVDPERVLGVRTPVLRRYARTLANAREAEARAFMEQMPHAFYDENNLHGELIGLLAKTPEEAFALLDAFLPCVDNWATCDLIRVPAFKRDLPATLERIRGWVSAEPECTVRFGVVQLMTLFLDDAFEPEHLRLVASIERPEYYVNMARAWYFSFALVKQPEATLPLFEERPAALDVWTHNKSLQKARESRRVTPEQKAYFQSLKVK